ncbi:hypothetical protein VQZ12_004900 [Salmonella enterica]|nr:hypothetical protein [Salmonella enterica subsp. salamae]EJU3354579.1 hypothetical protein [Salmonella enterica]EKC2495836.1 hypothetical protein [Salmonella enterica]EMD3918420.1 hypothetical protein [Salmonella enterica]
MDGINLRSCERLFSGAYFTQDVAACPVSSNPFGRGSELFSTTIFLNSDNSYYHERER